MSCGCVSPTVLLERRFQHFARMTSPAPTRHIVHSGLNCGHNTWSIHDSKLVHQIMNAQVGELFESKPFKMAQLLWTIRLYPNGNNANSKGSVKIFLKLVSMPHVLDQLILSYTTSCPQSMASSTALDIYLKSGDSKGWLNRSLLLNEWKNNGLNMIQIVVSVNIFKIKFKKFAVNTILSHFRYNQNETFSIYPKKQKLVYKIDTYTLSKFKQSYYGKRYESAIFNNMWRLRWFPNGANQDCSSYMSIYLVLCRIPYKIAQLTTKYRITCKELNRSISAVDDFSFAASNWGKSKFISLQEVSHLSTLTFVVDIDILEEVHSEREDTDIWDETQIHYVLGVNQQDAILPNSVSPQLEEFDDSGSQHQNRNNNNNTSCSNRGTPVPLTASGSRSKSPGVTPSPTQHKSVNVITLKKEIKHLKKRVGSKEKHIEQLHEKFNVMRHTLKEESRKRKTFVKQVASNMTRMEEYILNDDEKRQHMDNNYVATQLRIMKKQLGALQREVVANSSLHKKGNDEKTKEEEVKFWLFEQVQLPQYYDNLVVNGFDDPESLKDLTKKILVEIGIDKIGHQLKILRFVRRLSNVDVVNGDYGVGGDDDGSGDDDAHEHGRGGHLHPDYNEDDHEFLMMTNDMQRISLMHDEGGAELDTV